MNKLMHVSSENVMDCHINQENKNHFIKCLIYWGLAPMDSANNAKYYLSIIDEAMKYIGFFPLKRKLDVHNTFIKFKVEIENITSKKIKQLQMDNGGEFIVLKSFLQIHDIEHRRACLHAHQQMGMVERGHQHVVDSGLVLLNQTLLPHELWALAFSTVVFLYNRTALDRLDDDCPYERLFGEQPNLRDLQVFNCRVDPNL